LTRTIAGPRSTGVGLERSLERDLGRLESRPVAARPNSRLIEALQRYCRVCLVEVGRMDSLRSFASRPNNKKNRPPCGRPDYFVGGPSTNKLEPSCKRRLRLVRSSRERISGDRESVKPLIFIRFRVRRRRAMVTNLLSNPVRRSISRVSGGGWPKLVGRPTRAAAREAVRFP